VRRGALLRRLLAVLLCCLPSIAPAGSAGAPCQWLRASGLDGVVGPDPAQPEEAIARQLDLYLDLMRRPMAAPCRAQLLLREAQGRIHTPRELYRWGTGLLQADAGSDSSPAAMDADGPGDALAAGLAWMTPLAERSGDSWPPPLPDRNALPDPLRTEVGRMLLAMGRAYGRLLCALEAVPVDVTAEVLRGQLIGGRPAPALPDSADIRSLLPRIDQKAMLGGMLDLVSASERLQKFVATARTLPRVAWEVQTPLGVVLIDTTGRNNSRRLAAPLLLLDVGGDDDYAFIAEPAARRMTVLIDHGGNDRYAAATDGADPSSATLGYGVLWDGEGDDRYEGAHFAQAAALFGAALLVDGGGANRFAAAGHAQGYAFGGIALLLGGPGADVYSARTHAQASAGPGALALLIDPAGDDRYLLENTPLLRPSPQLPTHSTSMGQGAGRGIRGDDGPPAAGGIGILIDLAGNDRYTAQVFAQGAGYFQGAGLLIDAAGDDRFHAAWYAMGAAAHAAVGVLLKPGHGNDRYHATHSAALGAAHDQAVAMFFDEDGDDRYHLGDLGVGASHDEGIAAFIDVAGRDRYVVEASACRAFGVRAGSDPAPGGDRSTGIGLFFASDTADFGGRTACEPTRDRAGPQQ
jgi:hypothetical protein